VLRTRILRSLFVDLTLLILILSKWNRVHFVTPESIRLYPIFALVIYEVAWNGKGRGKRAI
jgi:hypothetical protein